jgi:two-component system sensor histidine kinase RpfC
MHQEGRILVAAARTMVSRARAAFRAVATCPRPDAKGLRLSDRQIARNRLLFGLGAAAYYAWVMPAIGELESPAPITVNAVYLLLATAALFMARLSPWRLDIYRKVMLLVDVSALSGAFIAGAPAAAPILFLYIWLIIGYGFRYGIFYLRLAAMASFGGILVALLCTDFWHTQPFVSAGMLMLAVVIPPYLELLMRRAFRANEAAMSANHSKALMLAGLGHALRAPLGSILNAAQSLSGSVLDLAQGRALDAIQAAAGSVIHELDDFLDVSRIDAERMPRETTSFSVKGLIMEALAAAAVQGASKGVAVSWYISPEVPERIWAERRHLLKALTNMAENAVKFTHVGSVVVTACMEHQPADKRRLRIEILDTGIGVPSGARDRIFDIFTQATPDILPLFGGAGLGLAMAKRLIELHSGQIGVESVEGRGSTFWFEVPVRAATSWEETTCSLDGTTVVVVTANTTDMIQFADRLERMGATTFLSEKADWWDTIPDDKLYNNERTIVIVDGRDVKLSEISCAVQNRRLLDHVPMIALTKRSCMPGLSIRRRFVTAIGSDAPDEHLVSALYLVGAFTREHKLETRDTRRGGSHSGPQVAVGRNRVLIADTSHTNVLILSKILERGGYSCLVVDTGESALDAAESEIFDMMFMNVDQPAIDGLEAVKMLRFQELGKRRNTILGLTSKEDPETAKRCKEAGCDDVVLQPIDIQKVLDLAAHVLSQQPQAGPFANQASSIIRSISSHPRYRIGLGPAIDDASFPYLTSIGGVPFVVEVMRLFMSEAEQAIVKLSNALERDDVDGFRNSVVSLGESAAVIGAGRLSELCKTAGVLSKDRLTLAERALFATLRGEAARVVQGIKDHVPAASDLSGVAANDLKPGKP